MPRRRKSRSLGSMPDTKLFQRFSDSAGHDIDMLEFITDAVAKGNCAKAYAGIRDTLRGDGYREALLKAIDADPDRQTDIWEIKKAFDQNSDIWARLVEQEDKFTRKCLRPKNEVPLESRLVTAKKRKK